MLDEALDPRTVPTPDFGRLLSATRVGEPDAAASMREWRHYWNDGASAWTNIRTIEHWIERSRR